MSRENISSIRKKILNGVDIAYKKLLENQVKNDTKMAIAQNGKITIVKAIDIFVKE